MLRSGALKSGYNGQGSNNFRVDSIVHRSLCVGCRARMPSAQVKGIESSYSAWKTDPYGPLRNSSRPKKQPPGIARSKGCINGRPNLPQRSQWWGQLTVVATGSFGCSHLVRRLVRVPARVMRSLTSPCSNSRGLAARLKGAYFNLNVRGRYWIPLKPAPVTRTETLQPPVDFLF